ncbi:MAG: hypothetical protein QM730_17385 [Anaerolineales bacterium]
MKKSLLVLSLVALVLFACSPAASTSAPAAETNWQTYTNADVGFSIQYPANWQEQDLPDENDGQMHSIALNGPEGEIVLKWGVGFGGACPQGYEQIAVAKGTVSACHTQKEDGTELWSLTGDPLGNTGFGGVAQTNDTSTASRDLVLQIISTLRFP